MTTAHPPTWIAFARSTRLACGQAAEVAAKVKAFIDSGNPTPVLVLDASTSHPIELDLRGSLEDVLKRLPAPTQPQAEPTPQEAVEPLPAVKTAGRPKLGVTAREVTLLPRHWDWLATQPGGASVSLRKLVEQALRASKETDQIRVTRDATYRFMSALAGNEPGFEEATRALFSGNEARWHECLAAWPLDVRDHALNLAQAAFLADHP
jgi:hypothetical protein